MADQQSAIYSQREDSTGTRLDSAALRFRLLLRGSRLRWSQSDFVRSVVAQGAFYRDRSHGSLQVAGEHLRRQLVTRGLHRELAVQSFALAREIAERTLGTRPYPVQLAGGWALLRGTACEMATGEGKTLTATLPACTAALSGLKVHLVTVNDYLAARDAQRMGPLYEALGLSVGTVVHGMSHRDRQHAYSCDVTYCTSKELVFDYLRDQIATGGQTSRLHLQLEQLGGGPTRTDQILLQGLQFAIVDELDSVLIDEARTPLVISEPGEEATDVYRSAASLADGLIRGTHYDLDRRTRRAVLTTAGRELVSDDPEFGRRGFPLVSRARFEEALAQYLVARELYVRDRDYIVRDGSVEIVDGNTGRSMPDRSWEHGLHQAIETKEGCDLTPPKESVARISYQRFFRRYLHLAGMTGTAREVRGELAETYGLPTVTVATNRPAQRRRLPTRYFKTAREKWYALVERVREIHSSGRPILIGTRTVAQSELCSRLLETQQLPHRVLNARQDQGEAEVVEQAGNLGGITVATQMAGRGTDIPLPLEVVARGGLHVIATELHDSRRVDRQLFGRCGRQGDPGTFECYLSLEDELVVRNAFKLASGIKTRWREASPPVPSWVLESVFRHAQRGIERRDRRTRRVQLGRDEQTRSALAFAGQAERGRESSLGGESWRESSHSHWRPRWPSV